MLLPEEFAILEGAVRSAIEDWRIVIDAVGCMPDHVHVAASIPPALAVAEVARRWKGLSSHAINQRRRANNHPESFNWQAEYGVHTFGPGALSSVVAYVQNQHEHHRLNDLWPGLERTTTEPPARPVLNPGGVSSP
jgi:REP element-mobilizing transposase RayT